jgi:hypothetical protein
MCKKTRRVQAYGVRCFFFSVSTRVLTSCQSDRDVGGHPLSFPKGRRGHHMPLGEPSALADRVFGVEPEMV